MKNDSKNQLSLNSTNLYINIMKLSISIYPLRRNTQMTKSKWKKNSNFRKISISPKKPISKMNRKNHKKKIPLKRKNKKPLNNYKNSVNYTNTLVKVHL